MVVLVIYGLIDIISAVLIGMIAFGSTLSTQIVYLLLAIMLMAKGIVSILWDAK